MASIRNGIESSLIDDDEGVLSDADEVTDSFQSVTEEQIMRMFAKCLFHVSWPESPLKY